MNKIFILLLGTMFCCNYVIAQNNYNVVCKDFTFQNKECKTCGNLKQIFEFSISKPNSPFKLIEREKMDKIFEVIQEEKNLYKDLSNEFNKKLQLAGVDFLVVGNLDQNVGTGTYSLFINFIKITGKDVTEKLPLLITINQSQFSNDDDLKKVFDDAIETFTNSYFIVKNNNNNLVTVPEFLKELNKRDSIINHLQSDANLKDKTISNLSNSITTIQQENIQKQKEITELYRNVSDIKEYTNIAKFNILGLEHDPGGDLIETSPISKLMYNVVEYKDNLYHIKFTDSALGYASQVIVNFPNFPFGYYTKGIIKLSRNPLDADGLSCLNKALEIFKITTTISGHNPQHDQALSYLKTIITSPPK
jgi:tetratricopeptide (TPR) repeat protein